jgi:hypothetical protein
MKKNACLTIILLFAGFVQVNCQGDRINGVVRNVYDGIPLPWASIVVQGTTTGTVSNEDGQFWLNVPEQHNTLCISFIGMRTRKYEISGRRNNEIEILLVPDVVEMDEITILYDTLTGTSCCFPAGFTGDTLIISGKDKHLTQIGKIGNL